MHMRVSVNCAPHHTPPAVCRLATKSCCRAPHWYITLAGTPTIHPPHPSPTPPLHPTAPIPHHPPQLPPPTSILHPPHFTSHCSTSPHLTIDTPPLPPLPTFHPSPTLAAPPYPPELHPPFNNPAPHHLPDLHPTPSNPPHPPQLHAKQSNSTYLTNSNSPHLTHLQYISTSSPPPPPNSPPFQLNPLTYPSSTPTSLLSPPPHVTHPNYT